MSRSVMWVFAPARHECEAIWYSASVQISTKYCSQIIVVRDGSLIFVLELASRI
ncbi:hypothetical protein ACFQ8Q_23375 [Streptomyces cyaneofuscatus]|uniref:hypothetical protein n=1 Tax=Streptomyces cyaneofuscatus TaxID=66883 RepID=UPI0036B32295